MSHFKPKIIILSQPKCASSSLLASLGKLLNYSVGQVGVNKEIPSTNIYDNTNERLSQRFPADRFINLGLFHGDICDLTEEQFTRFWQFDIQKQHLPPTSNNIDYLLDKKVVFLRRNSLDIINSLLRDETVTYGAGYIHKLLNSNTFFKDSLLLELDNWELHWKRNHINSIWLEYDDLINFPKSCIDRILDYFSISKNIDTDFKLERIRVPSSKKI